METEATGGEALRRSWRLTDDHEGTIFRLIVEAIIAMFLAAYIGNWIGFYLARRFDFGMWAGWTQWIVVALVGAAAQIPMYVGFALLYTRASSTTAAAAV